MRKPARNLLRSIARLRGNLHADRDHLARRLGDRAARRGAPPEDPAALYGPVFDHLDAELDAAHRDLAAAETAYDVAGVRLGQLRPERERAAADLRESQAYIERFCRSQPHLKGAVIVDRTPVGADALEHQVRLTLEFLRGLEADAAAGRQPPLLVGGAQLDPGAVADDLETGLPPLAAATVAVDRAESDLRVAREGANLAFAGAGRVVSWVFGALDNLCQLAGEEELARRIRKCRV